jgi:hypothetical protein
MMTNDYSSGKDERSLMDLSRKTALFVIKMTTNDSDMLSTLQAELYEIQDQPLHPTDNAEHYGSKRRPELSSRSRNTGENRRKFS